MGIASCKPMQCAMKGGVIERKGNKEIKVHKTRKNERMMDGP